MATREACASDQVAPGCNRHPFDGLIQHSVGLQLDVRHRPFFGRTNSERVTERFALQRSKGPTAPVRPVADQVEPGSEPEPFRHSPLAGAGLTTIQSLKMKLPGAGGALPNAFGWSNGSTSPRRDPYEEPRLIFADEFDDPNQATVSDFMVDVQSHHGGAAKISQTLLEVMAHKRSRLFGFALANRFVNVMLPHAILEPAGCEPETGAWFLQPLVSFIRGGRDRTRLRSTYSLSFFLLPVSFCGEQLCPRAMSLAEVGQIGTPGWGFAASPADGSVPEFTVRGFLLDYLSHLSRFDLSGVRPSASKGGLAAPGFIESADRLTLRQTAEKIGFGVGLSVAQGSAGCADLATMRRIGNDIVMALGSARVSSVVVVDTDISALQIRNPLSEEPLPRSLALLMSSLAEPLRAPLPSDSAAEKFRLDRPFDDDDIYATGVIPSRRCLVVASRASAQFGARESALMQAGSIGYMTLGAATAIATLREIDRQLEHLEGANPSRVAAIDREIAADLNEIYDLDITRESYRRMYRRLRDRLGITRDYKTLQDEMQTLYRAASTVHVDKSQRLLALLTAAIVALSVLILVVTFIK